MGKWSGHNQFKFVVHSLLLGDPFQLIIILYSPATKSVGTVNGKLLWHQLSCRFAHRSKDSAAAIRYQKNLQESMALGSWYRAMFGQQNLFS